MGGGASKIPRGDELDKIIYNELQKTMDCLAIEKKDVVQFWLEFIKIDLDSTGNIGLEEPAMTKKVPLTDYGKCVLGEMDLDGDGSLKFSEFYVGLWNFLAADNSMLHKLMFEMADRRNQSSLCREDINQMVFLMYGTGPNKKSSADMTKILEKIMKAMDPNSSDEVSMAVWQKNASKTPELFKQTHELQAQLQKAYFGKAFWTKATKMRTSVLGNDNMLKKHAEFYNIKYDVGSFEAAQSSEIPVATPAPEDDDKEEAGVTEEAPAEEE